MYRDDLAATHARMEQLQRELSLASRQGVTDQQRIAALSATGRNTPRLTKLR